MSERINLLRESMNAVGLGASPQNLIDGLLCDGNGNEVTLVDPYTEKPLFTYKDADVALATEACNAARAAQPKWAKALSATARSAIMQNISKAVTTHTEPLATIESITAGKPIKDCRVEVSKVAEMFSYYAGWADKLHGEVIPVPSGHLNYTMREPLGVVFQMTPWNAPIFTGGWQIAPAIATGNAVVIKPSELTPITTVALVKLAEDVGLPTGLVNVLCGLGPTTGQAAIEHPAVRKVVFVGSPETGRKVATAAAASLKPTLLELGGKSANIVFADANIEHACLGIQAAIFSSAGQSCVAGSRLLVEKSIHRELIAMLNTGMNKIKLGDPLEETTQIGPLGNARQFSHVRSMISQANDAGATVLTRNETQATGYFVPPTVLEGLNNDATAAQQEIFGPVVTVIPFENEAEAISLANNTEFGLAGAVWTKDVGRAHRVAQEVRAGTFWINSYKAIHVSSPFGGSLNSGFGRSSGTDALHEYTAAKSVWLDSAVTPTIAFGYVS
jgi:acyl-CoA reductase-like NAD-dependent aldehyde dehydrogenase